jgi:hypothetical protein
MAKEGAAQGRHVDIDGSLELPHSAFPDFDQNITLGSVALELHHPLEFSQISKQENSPRKSQTQVPPIPNSLPNM